MVRIITLKDTFILGSIILSYLIGSIPTAYLLVKMIKGQDIRKIGSGNVGATNASRILGKPAGFFILIVDMLKGVIPVVFIADGILKRFYFSYPDILRLILGILAIIGHNWPVFLNFKGGKGVATTFGVLLGLALRVNGLIWVLLSCVVVWIVSLLLARIVSLASVLSAIFLPLFMFFYKQKKEFIIISFIFSLFIILRHIPNIKRILNKKEPRIF